MPDEGERYVDLGEVNGRVFVNNGEAVVLEPPLSVLKELLRVVARGE
jgi:hypothetical protein